MRISLKELLQIFILAPPGIAAIWFYPKFGAAVFCLLVVLGIVREFKKIIKWRYKSL